MIDSDSFAVGIGGTMAFVPGEWEWREKIKVIDAEHKCNELYMSR